ncbi:LacI family DNA-binding transcriptional regulator [Dyadobacter frigoris]|uniref:LacI family transcriptional regulator n=1 Tax=Dyadobacter frigoris TaxID=2576211 RepID=A0A4U6CXV3_9BACT|nr:LacI family DNA-binding transcriptional regulator [Dyadobacter frigoris]TKT89700.1 LacI family transcriptional regulator [Dyadobacter frigoris]GLU54074.1 LacI family transcriptional regulator [Dyadobacter frigoris]
MEKEITIYDIAKILGLSPATVSRALNDHPAINSKTKILINEKAIEMGYQSNTFASNLRRRRTNTLGVIVPRLNSNFMSAVLAGMEEEANISGYNLLISQSLESAKKEISNAKTMFNSRVDGLLASVAYDTDTFDHFESFIKKGIPVLFFDRIIDHPKCSGVVIDNVLAGFTATSHLIEKGCKRIMHVTGNLKRNVYSGRLKGYQDALLQNNLTASNELLMITDLSQEAGKYVAQKIDEMEIRPDGIFISNDICAVSCMKALKEKGYNIPDDIAVVGFNNDPVSQVIEPNLTTVYYPGQEMGKVAIRTIVNHLKGIQSIDVSDKIVLPSELIIRKSSLKEID